MKNIISIILLSALFVGMVGVQPASADGEAPVLLNAFNQETGRTQALGIMISMPVCKNLADALTKFAALPPADGIVFFCTQSVSAS